MAHLKSSEEIRKLDNLLSEIEEELQSLEKVADSVTTSLRYIDEAGNEFSANEIVTQGFKPKGKYKPHSLSHRINNPSFGKVKRSK